MKNDLNGINMPYPRSKTVNLDVTEYYHVVTRCVRRSFLCGVDKYTGESYEHRKSWIQNRLIKLDKVFCIDICSFAIMSNHTHIVVKVNRKEALKLTDTEVLERWHNLFNGTNLSRSFLKNQKFPEDPKMNGELIATIKEIRDRLFDLSWYMKSINEYIAKKANKEDDCTGHFWEGRYYSQAILDFSALISTMIYVDLNPLRAGLVKTPEQAIYTSLHRRITALKLGVKLKYLMKFREDSSDHKHSHCIDMSLEEYLQLIDYAAQRMHQTPNSGPCDRAPPLHKRLVLQNSEFLELSQNVEAYFPVAVGSIESLNEFKRSTGRSRIKGASNALRLYRENGNKEH